MKKRMRPPDRIRGPARVLQGERLLRRAALVAVVLGATASGAIPAEGQASEEIASGQFEIRVEDRRVGTETFAVRREDGVVRAAGRIALDGAAAGLTPMDVRMQMNSNFRPNSYALRARQGEVRGVDGVWSGDRLRLHISSDEGERWKEFLTPGPVAILEHGVAHHFYVLFRQLSANPAGAQVSVIIPSRNRQATARVQGGGSETLRVSGEDRDAVQWVVEVDGTRHLVWLDGEGRVLRVAVPSENRVATLTEP